MPTDLNQRAKAIVDLATGEREVADPDEGKNGCRRAELPLSLTLVAGLLEGRVPN